MTKEKRITLKHAYLKLTFYENKLQTILDCINNGKPLTAYHNVQDLLEWTKDIMKPVYDALPLKAKLQFLDGWTPDTDSGSYIEVPYKGIPKRKEKNA